MKRAESSLNQGENTVGKGEMAFTSNFKSSFSFSHSVFKRIVLLTNKIQGLFGKGLKAYKEDVAQVVENRNLVPEHNLILLVRPLFML